MKTLGVLGWAAITVIAASAAVGTCFWARPARSGVTRIIPSDAGVSRGDEEQFVTLFIIQKDFEDGADTDPVVGEDDAYDATSSAVYDAGDGYGGSQGARDDLVGDAACLATNQSQWGGVIVLPQQVGKGVQLHIRIRVKYATGFNFNTDSGMKFIRINRVNGVDPAHHYDLYIHPTGVDGKQCYLSNESGTDTPYYLVVGCNPVVDAWETWELRYTLDDVSVDLGGTGRVKVYKDDTLIVDRTDEPTLNDAAEEVESVLFNTHWNRTPCDAPDQDQTVYTDDVRVVAYQ